MTAEAGSVQEAIDEADRTRPDIVVMDVRLVDGAASRRRARSVLRSPKTQVLMLTSFADDEALFASIMAGASGYVLKQVRSDDLLRAIRSVGGGESLLDPAVTKAVLERLRKGKHLMSDEKLARLSPQEERILTWSPTAGRTRRSARSSSWRRRPSRTTCAHPLEARGGPARGGGGVPRSPHHHPGLRRVATDCGPKVPPLVRKSRSDRDPRPVAGTLPCAMLRTWRRRWER